jgi:hypothetical protein
MIVSDYLHGYGIVHRETILEAIRVIGMCEQIPHPDLIYIRCIAPSNL